jgi:hypothetical protein
LLYWQTQLPRRGSYQKEEKEKKKVMAYFTIKKAEDLLSLHPDAQAYHKDWQKYQAVVEGFNALADLNIFKQHSRESQSNFQRRLSEGYGPNYSEAIINIFDYYLLQSEISRKFGKLAEFELWEIFQKDSDYYRTDYNIFLNQARKKASIFGHMGIMIDMPIVKTNSQKESIERKIYPYLSLYSPLDILNWIVARDGFGRPELVALKLKQHGDVYKIWEKDSWRSYIIREKGKVQLLESGVNKLGEIPFVWLFNADKSHYIGESDLKNIANIDISIYNNCMQIEEIVDLAAFPMMRRPMKRQGEEGQEDRVGPSAVQEFDPSLGEAGKPDWMRAEVSDPIKAILDTIVWKIAQIYRNATLSEAVAERKTGESGYALSIRRDLLNAALVAKAKYLAEAEERIAYFWCRWIGKDEWVKDIKIERPKRFSVEQLKLDLENAVLGKSVIHSETFSKELQKKLAREMMGTGIDDKKYSEIDEEIEVYEPLKVPEIEIEEE